MGGSISDEDFTSIILGSISQLYDSYIAAITATSSLLNKTLSSTNLIDAIRDEADRRTIKNPKSKKEGDDMAFVANQSSDKGKKGGEGSKRAKKGKCYNCKKTGVRVSPVALRLGSEIDPCRRDLTNFLLSYLVSDSFGPVLGARAWSCKTASDYLSLSQLRNTSETFRERCFRLPPGLLIFYIAFLLYGLMGLTIPDYIYSSFL